MRAREAAREGPGPETPAPPRAGFGEGLLWAYLYCPDCRSGQFQVVSDGETTNMLCLSCHRCWHPEAGYLSRVDPLTCPGCPSRAICLCPIVGPVVDYALARGVSPIPGWRTWGGPA